MVNGIGRGVSSTEEWTGGERRYINEIRQVTRMTLQRLPLPFALSLFLRARLTVTNPRIHQHIIPCPLHLYVLFYRTAILSNRCTPQAQSTKLYVYANISHNKTSNPSLTTHNDPRSNVDPFCRPPAYCLARGTNWRGGGKSVTGNVCVPALGGGDGTVKKKKRSFV
jgi:hypothetical protein